ncbi:MAG: hypothetical protein WA864_00635 [Acetobacteraceae bacterium]
MALRYERQARIAGGSKYTLPKMLRFALDAVTGFSTIPLRLATWFGFGAALVAFGLLIVTSWSWATGQTVLGWSSIMTAIVFFGAVQLIVLGILGEYVGRLFLEAKQRPLFLVDEIVAGTCSLSLPPEFASLDPAARREIWEATRGGPTRVLPLVPPVPMTAPFNVMSIGLK